MVNANETPEQRREKIVTLIENCLRLSKSSNEHEAAAAAAKAAELLAKYNIDMADIDEAGDTKAAGPKMETDRSFRMKQSKPGVSYYWRLRLAATIADHFFCRSYTSAGSGPKRVSFIGEAHNIAAVKAMFIWLADVLERVADDAKAKAKRERLPKTAIYAAGEKRYKGSAALKNFRRSFLEGAVNGVSKALDERARAAAANEKALVIRNEEQLDAYEAMAITFSKSKAKPAYDPHKRSFDWDAFDKGIKAGKSVPLADSTRIGRED